MNKYVLALVFIISSNVSAQSIPLYGLFEVQLTNTKNYNNPFSDVVLMVSPEAEVDLNTSMQISRK